MIIDYFMVLLHTIIVVLRQVGEWGIMCKVGDLPMHLMIISILDFLLLFQTSKLLKCMKKYIMR